jgi:3-carboxy-cis,cis-muconate cycloisomerase
VALQLREALDAARAAAPRGRRPLRELAGAHRDTVMAGRTLGQQAVPITFGLKAARWLGAFDRRIEQLRWVVPGSSPSSSAARRDRWPSTATEGRAVAEALATSSVSPSPTCPGTPNATGSSSWLGAHCHGRSGSRMWPDLVLLAQSEIAEVREAAGEGPSSSAMPNKRNPVARHRGSSGLSAGLGELGVLTAAAGGHEQERAAGAWQAEWVALPSAMVRTGGALTRLGAALDGLEVDVERARNNLDHHHGLTASEALATALIPALGREQAHAVAGEVAAIAAREARNLREVARHHQLVTAHLDDDILAEVLDPGRVSELAGPLINRALATHERLRGERATGGIAAPGSADADW